MRKGKKLFSVLLSAAMMAGSLPVAAFAEEPVESACNCGVPCTEEQVNAECPVCGIEGEDIRECAGQQEGEAEADPQEQKPGNTENGGSVGINVNNVNTGAIIYAGVTQVQATSHSHDGIHFESKLESTTITGGYLTAGSYYLESDLTLSSDLRINGAVNLCLNGKTVTLGKYYIYITSGASLTICDCDAAGQGKITASSTEDYAIYNSGTLNLKGGTLDYSCTATRANAAAIQNSVNGVVNLSGGEVTSSTSRAMFCPTVNSGTDTGSLNISGSAVLSSSGSGKEAVWLGTGRTLHMTGGTITSEDDGILSFGTVNVSGGEITAKKIALSNYSGGSAAISGSAKLTSTGNSAVSNGSATGMTITGGEITTNSAGPNDAGVQNTGKLKLSGGTITATAQAKGISNSGTLEITDGQVNTKSGAGISNQFNVGATATVSGGTVTSEGLYALDIKYGTVTVSGQAKLTSANTTAAVYCNSASASLKVSGGTIEATGQGSSVCGIYIDNSGFSMSGGTVTVTQTNGGHGIHSKSSKDITISGGTVETKNTRTVTVYAVKHEGTGTLTLSGSPVITGGSANLYIAQGVDAADSAKLSLGGAASPYTGGKLTARVNYLNTLVAGKYIAKEATADHASKIELVNPNLKVKVEYDNNAKALKLADQTFTVTLPTDTGYRVEASSGSSSPVADGGSYSFKVNLAERYYKTAQFAVKANDTNLTPTADGLYTISNITEDKTVTVTGVEKDTNPPTVEIHEGTNTWSTFLNTITFGLFFKETKQITVDATDGETGVATVQYVVSGEELTQDTLKTVSWTDYPVNGFNINPNGKNIIYAKATDRAGNEKIVNSQGIVLYADSVQDTAEISFTRKGTNDVNASVTLNGNTVKEIKCGEEKLKENTDYTVDGNGTITFKNGWLKTKPAGQYTLTIHYNPLGVTYVEAEGNQAPGTTTVQLNVQKMTGSVTVTNASSLSKTYDGAPVADVAYQAAGAGNVTVEYKAKGASDDTYTGNKPVNAGEYTVRVTKAADNDYTEGIGTADFTIARRSIVVKGIVAENKVYDGGTEAVLEYKDVKLDGKLEHDKVSVEAAAEFEDANAGSAKKVSLINLKLTGADVSNYVLAADGQQKETTADIRPAVLSGVRVSQTGTLTDSGKPQTADVQTEVSSIGDQEVTFTYSETEDGVYTETVPSFTKAGVYTVYYKASAPNHEEFSGTFTVTIAKTEQTAPGGEDDESGKKDSSKGTTGDEAQSASQGKQKLGGSIGQQNQKNSKGKQKPSVSVKTEDPNNIWMWLVLAALSLMCGGSTAYWRRKDEKLRIRQSSVE